VPLATNSNTTNTTRISGADPVSLGVNLSRLVYPSPRVSWRPNMAMIAPVDDCPTALAAASLIHHPHNGPLFLSPRDRLPVALAAELERLKLTGRREDGKPLRAHVFLVGPFRPEVVRGIQAIGYRVAYVHESDPIRIAQAVMSYRRALREAIGDPLQDLMVARVEQCEGALGAAALGAHTGIPILFTRGERVPQVTTEAIRSLGNPNLYLLATDSADAEELSLALGQLTEGRVVQIGGRTPAETAIALARYQSPEKRVGWGRTQPEGHAFAFAPEERWQSAVLAGLLGYTGKRAPLLLVPKGEGLPAALTAYLRSLHPPLAEPPGPPFMHGFIMGDEDGISWAQQVLLEEQLIKEAGESGRSDTGSGALLAGVSRPARNLDG
jgi:hypothetical protein